MFNVQHIAASYNNQLMIWYKIFCWVGNISLLWLEKTVETIYGVSVESELLPLCSAKCQNQKGKFNYFSWLVGKENRKHIFLFWEMKYLVWTFLKVCKSFKSKKSSRSLHLFQERFNLQKWVIYRDTQKLVAECVSDWGLVLEWTMFNC